MKPPLILMAHFDLSELSLCPDCNRVSNDTLSCNACGNRLGLLSLSQALNGRAAAEATGGLGARGGDVTAYEYVSAVGSVTGL